MKRINGFTRILIIGFLIVGSFSTMGAAWMQTGTSLYIDGVNGSDTNNGLTTSSALKTIQKAVSIVQPGTTIYVRSGTYNENIVVTTSGTQSAPITLTPYPGDSVVINGNGTMALRTSGAVAYWVLEGLTIKSMDRYTVRLGWWGEPLTDHWTLRNNKLFGANYVMGSYHLWEGNDIDGTGYPGTNGDAGISDGGDSHHNIYRSNYVHDFTNVDARGIWTQGKTHDSLIENNTVTNINTASGLGQCIDLDGAAQVEWRHTVRGNKVSRCSYVGIQLENVFDSVIEDNVITGGTAGIIDINYDASFGCVVGGESNQYGDTNGDGSCQGDITNNILRQNLITTTSNWGWGYGGIMNWYAGGLKIWGNTISSSGAAGNGGINFQGTLSQTKGGSIKSNIVTQGSGAAICATDLASFVEDIDNLVYRTNNGKPYAKGGGCDTEYSLAEYQTMSGKGQNSLSVDPLFVNSTGGDFHLTASSPAIDKGISVDTVSDIEGSVRPINVTYDLGAYEFGGTPVQTSLTATLLPTSLATATVLPTYLPTVTGLPTSTPPPTLTPANMPTQSTGNNIALGKPAMQSSVYGGADATRAVDGNTDGNFANNSVTHTNVDAQAWWQVDLGAATQIQSIKVWARTDCCEWRSNNVYVLVSDTPFSSTGLDSTRTQTGVSNYYIAGNVGRPSAVNVNRTGRYVRVQLTGTDNLSLAEVEVFGSAAPTALPTTYLLPTNTPTYVPTATRLPNTPIPTIAATTTSTNVPTATRLPNTPIPTIAPTRTSTNAPTATRLPNTPVPTNIPTNAPVQASSSNLAKGKPATQSSVYSGAVASRAVDGNTDGNFANNSVTHTNVDAQAWWQVDLGATTPIQSINVWARTDCCEWRSNNVYVFVSDTPFSSTNLAGTRTQTGVSNYYISGNVGKPSVVNVNRTGRYVRVQLTGTDNLSLAEVEVIGGNSTVVLPTNAPLPSNTPTSIPTATRVPNTQVPTSVPTTVPTYTPTAAPSFTPTTVPTLVPTLVPTTIESQSSIRNLALGMTAVQSSDFSGAIAARAVDGNTDGNLANNSVTHTNEDTQAWWQVDLGSPSPIQSINLWARTDCCEWRTNNVYVLVSDNPILSGALDTARNQAGVSSYLISGLVGRPSTVDIYRTGRYIRVQLTGKDFLSLAEVEVMGGPGVVLPAQSLQSATAVPSATSTLMPTSIPAATELPTLPANTAMPTFTPLPLDPTIIPSFTPTLVQ